MTETSGSGDVHRSLALLWDPTGGPARGQPGRLSLEAVVDAAISVADADGLEAVSMRRIAGELGVGTMSLYRHVPGKEELLDLMLDRVLGDDDPTPFPVDWRATLERYGREVWALYRTHRWLPFVDQSRPLLGPRAVTGMEAVLGGLTDTPASDTHKILAFSMVETYVAGLARVTNGAELAEERSGVSTEEFWQAQGPVLVAAMQSGRFPRMAALDEEVFATTPEETFEFGLGVLLDGLAPRLGGTAVDSAG
ncbi:TetR/AcrR family transcriptional regulator [Ornithinimicrobium sp. F0845]|uniref:TetR/AcrR family transcriptional regulator n=1 Tax=Ornithinimicrobium sp. F0845 TaxID=2926412 RepID=UPI001FF665E7|nr:TetR/AcrR family transcriptional regulator [Ornithinimicrobium sp. F0845]MCK0114030.1 TetR/AcrR family transcriptional regulator [Ornithinimicrobium sp. F0845]